MLLRDVQYARPLSVDEAVVLLSEHEDARPLAGGQSLMNAMKQRVASPEVVVDLNGLHELRAITRTPAGALELGAMVTYTQLVLSPEVGGVRPILSEVALQIADVQVRNRGTIGGNICWSDPANHFLPVVTAIGATMTIRGRDGERTVPAEEFFLGVYMSAVNQGELLTKITIPAGGERSGDGFASVAVGKDGTAIVTAAASVNGGAPRVVVGCVDAIPVRATGLEQALADGASDGASLTAAAKGLGATLDPPDDVHASADYRRHLVEVIAARAALQAVQRARR